MKRRQALIGTALMAGMTAGNARAQDAGDRFGEIVIPPAQERDEEKHVPIITAPSTVTADEFFEVTVEVGKVVKHPNTVEHHIRSIRLYVLEEGSSYAVEAGSYEFAPVTSDPKVTIPIRISRNATLYALEHCNIHGLWDYSFDVTVR